MLLCMRTTVDIDDPLFHQLKQEAVRRGTTLRSLINEYLRKARIDSRRSSRYRFRWKTERGHLQPGVRLEDRESLWDLMDGR